MVKKQKVVRTYSSSLYTNKVTDELKGALENGWLVIRATPMTDKNGTTDSIEYILEKEE